MYMCQIPEHERRKNPPFGKDERLHLLSIMRRYAPLLDDKNASIGGRKQIWRTIEERFNEAGFVGKTSAQLKKYWQNYKYHCKRRKTVRKDDVDCTSATPTMPTLDDVSCWEDRQVGAKFRETNETSDKGCTSLVATAEEKKRRACEIYEKNGATSFRKLSVGGSERIRSPDPGRTGFEDSASTERPCVELKHENLHERNEKTKNRVKTAVIVSNPKVLDNSVTVSIICAEKKTTGNHSEHSAKMRTSDENGSVNSGSEDEVETALRKQRKKLPDESSASSRAPKKFYYSPEKLKDEKKEIREREERVERSEMREDKEIKTEVQEITKKQENKHVPVTLNTRKKLYSSFRAAEPVTTSIEKCSSFLEKKRLSNKTLWTENNHESVPSMNSGAPSVERSQINSPINSEINLENQVRFSERREPSSSNDSASKKRPRMIDEVVHASSSSSACFSSSLRILRPKEASISAHAGHVEDAQRPDAVENVNRDDSSKSLGRGGRERDENSTEAREIRSADYLVQTEFQRLNHRLILRQLETEERRLKVKIAEMAVQEIRFRIKALNEDMQRAEELYELRLALTARKQDVECSRVSPQLGRGRSRAQFSLSSLLLVLLLLLLPHCVG